MSAKKTRSVERVFLKWRKAEGASAHQEHRAGTFDLTGDLAMKMRRHPGDAAGKDLAGLGDEFLQELGVLVVDGLEGDIDAPAQRRCRLRLNPRCRWIFRNIRM